MTVSTIIIVIICFSVIIHHLYKVKDELNDIKEIVSRIERTQNYFFKQTDQQPTQIDWAVSDIEDILEGKDNENDK